MQEIKKIKCSLAIVITTYKRSEEILSRIAELQDVISNKIKLYIFDDDPKSMLAQKISELNIKNIKYQKNRKNLGQSLNLITNIKNVEEDYIFISADDDIIDSQKLKKYFYLSYEQRAQITILDFLHIKELHLNKHFDGSFKVMLDSFAIINEVLKIGKGGNIIFKKNVNVICSTEDYYVGSLFEDKGLILKNLLHFKTVKGLLINDYIGSEQHSYGNELRYSLRVFMNFNMLRSQIYAMDFVVFR